MALTDSLRLSLETQPQTRSLRAFDGIYDEYIAQDSIGFGGREYYRRYRSRFKTPAEVFARLVPARPVDVLDIGGGQMALICSKIWGDRTTMAGLGSEPHAYMASHGVNTFCWNLIEQDAPTTQRFDIVFFLEVIEHLPVPGYIVLERLRAVLRPGGFIICTTPNLFRLRNLVLMALGRRVFDRWRYPDPGDDRPLEHVLEYSREHLEWQFARAGFAECEIRTIQMHHTLTNPLLRIPGLLAYPLHLVPHWRDSLIAIARA
jgi:2-polyprenyl-3-methyl-5-hydroxy-6-metoxy-1,4-benzoquinol methylase